MPVTAEDVKKAIEKLGRGPYKDGSSTKPAHLYHELPYPGLWEHVHKRTAPAEHARIVMDLEGIRYDNVADIGSGPGYHSVLFAEAGKHVVAFEADLAAAEVLRLVAEWRGLTIKICGAFPTNIPLRTDVALMLNSHQWIVKQLGFEKTKAYMRGLSGATRRLYFQTVHREGPGKARVEQLADENDIARYLYECGYNHVKWLGPSTGHGKGVRHLFRAMGQA